MLQKISGSSPNQGQDQSDAGCPVIVTVHGTNDADPADEGQRWWQRGSFFTSNLIEALKIRGAGQDVEVIPLHWSGANSDFDRFAGARALAKLLRHLEKSGRPHAIIAHSHGGNVTMEGLLQARRRKQVSSVVSFGTPFFLRRLKLIPWIIAVFQLVLGAVITPIMLWYLAVALSSDTNKKLEAVILFGGLAIVGVLSLRKGIRELRRGSWALRLLPRAVSPENWLVIHSPRDEAMRLLEAAAAISPKYVTVAAAVRALTAFGTIAGVLGTIILFGLSWRYFLDPIITKVSAGEFGLGTAADLTFLLLIPIVYGAIYGLVWLFARIGGGWLYAKSLSGAIHGGLIGAAYGGDGRFKLTGVTRTPPYLSNAKESRIEALNLGGIDDKAVFVSAQKLYDDFVRNDRADGGIGDPDKLWKRLSDALYHNAYMRDDGVIANVADHIVTGWSRSR